MTESLPLTPLPPLPWQPVPWHTAPSWAHWAAMDRTGLWFWYEEEPVEETQFFTARSGRVDYFAHPPYPGHWRFSQQPRPQPHRFFFSSVTRRHATLCA